MLDDLRNSSFLDDEEEEEVKQPEQQLEQPVIRRSSVRRRRSRGKTFLGLTAQQRFIVSLALFMMVCILGTFVLLITQTISLPF